LTGVAVFTAGIAAVRLWGDMLIPWFLHGMTRHFFSGKILIGVFIRYIYRGGTGYSRPLELYTKVINHYRTVNPHPPFSSPALHYSSNVAKNIHWTLCNLARSIDSKYCVSQIDDYCELRALEVWIPLRFAEYQR
jgi:hypothetical protein